MYDLILKISHKLPHSFSILCLLLYTLYKCEAEELQIALSPGTYIYIFINLFEYLAVTNYRFAKVHNVSKKDWILEDNKTVLKLY